VSSFQGGLGGETLDLLHGIEEHALKSLQLTNKTLIAITADSENGHEDAGRGELCVKRQKRERTF
jgi:hypothetical protein